MARIRRETVQAPLNTKKGLFDSTSDFYQNEKQNIKNRKKLIEMMMQSDLQMTASEFGMTVDTHQQTILMDRQHRQVMELEKFRRDNGLEGRQRVLLTNMELRERIEEQLFKLIDRLDAETHARKRVILEKEITKLEAERDGLGEQEMDEDGPPRGVRRDDKDPDGGGGPGKGPKTDREQD